MPLTSALVMPRRLPRSYPLLLLALPLAMLVACGSSKPAKYRKKRECDCPKWNHVPQHGTGGVHAFTPGVGPEGAKS